MAKDHAEQQIFPVSTLERNVLTSAEDFDIGQSSGGRVVPRVKSFFRASK